MKYGTTPSKMQERRRQPCVHWPFLIENIADWLQKGPNPDARTPRRRGAAGGRSGITRAHLPCLLAPHCDYRSCFDWLLHDAGQDQFLSLVSATSVSQVRDTRRDAVDLGKVVDGRETSALRFCKGAFHVGIVDGRGLLVNGGVRMG